LSDVATLPRERVALCAFVHGLFAAGTGPPYLQKIQDSTLRAFAGHTNPVFQGIDLLARKNDNLRCTRDLLLPKLLAGELKVRSLEHEEEAVIL